MARVTKPLTNTEVK